MRASRNSGLTAERFVADDGVDRRPMPSISVTTSSPTFTLTTPSGVPVRITSPGASVMKPLRYLDQRRDVVDHVAGVALLRHPAVDQRAQGKIVRMRHILRIHQPRAQHGASVAVFTRRLGRYQFSR